MRRAPAILVLALAIAGLFLIERNRAEPPAPTSLLSSAAVDAETGAGLGSTWYCAAGFMTPDAVNDHLVTVVNRGSEVAVGSLTLYPSRPDTAGNSVRFDRARHDLEVPAGGEQVVSLAPLVSSMDPQLSTETGAFVGALVEFASGDLQVSHRVVSPIGADAASCATTSSSTWWFSSGTTTESVAYQMYVLNPFPDDAVIDIRFVTDEGIREPTSLKGRLVPAHSLSVIDIASQVTVRQQATAEVTTRTGRVVVERIQLFRNEAGPIGLSLAPGTPELAEQWFFPAAGFDATLGESYVIFNPNEVPAEVEFELKPDSADRFGDVAPVPVPVGPNERWVVNVATHPTHPGDTIASIDATTMAPPGDGYFVSVRSFNGVGVSVERVLTEAGEPGRGVTAGFGRARASTDQVLSIPTWLVAEGDDDAPPVQPGQVAVLNPHGDTIAQVEVWVGSGDREPENPRQLLELAPRRRAAIDLNRLVDPGDEWVRIVSAAGVMAELVGAGPGELISIAATPATGSEAIPDLYAFE